MSQQGATSGPMRRRRDATAALDEATGHLFEHTVDPELGQAATADALLKSMAAQLTAANIKLDAQEVTIAALRD